jgi:hypothetical protein
VDSSSVGTLEGARLWSLFQISYKDFKQEKTALDTKSRSGGFEEAVVTADIVRA